MRIGLVPISAKPYHSGHHALVTRAAAENDKVILFVSLSDRKRRGEFPILGSDMHDIWSQFLEPAMPSNVTIAYGGSPVRNVYEELGKANDLMSDDVYTVYSDPEDTAQNYAESMRQKYFPDVYQMGNVLFAAEIDPAAFTRGVGTPNISGTKVRKMLELKDFESFKEVMPPGVDAKGVFDILTRSLTETWLRHYIQAVITD